MDRKVGGVLGIDYLGHLANLNYNGRAFSICKSRAARDRTNRHANSIGNCRVEQASTSLH
jgi:hypothetical protein